MNYLFRPLTHEDELVVWQMLMFASHEPTLQAVRSQLYLAQYAEGWGRTGDIGFVALKHDTRQPVGAAWLRLWSGDNKGFGFVDNAIPELAMAVLPEHRGRGVGTQLLAHVLQAKQAAYSAVSLNVRANNPVVRLYQRAGFVRVPGSEIINRTGGVSFNMVRSFTN